MADDRVLRKQLVEMLSGGHAHATFVDTVEGFPVKQAGVRPDSMPHSGWELLEHMRIAQNDILEFSRSPDYISPKWPDGYWPASSAPSGEAQWRKSVRLFREDLAAFEALLQDPGQDLNRPFPWGDGQTLLREALLIIDHNSYHLGQLMLVRRVLEA